MKHISVKVNGHTFTLANVEVYERMSEETTAFCADVLIDGIVVGECQNNGKGEGNYPYINREYVDLYRLIEDGVKKYHYHEENFYGRTLDWDYNMDFLIGMMVSSCYYDCNTEYKF